MKYPINLSKKKIIFFFKSIGLEHLTGNVITKEKKITSL
tara:strand:+ start:370 stop:486 length:117 start_codon:yes stop_codon:yes gene_type:complete